MTAVAALDELSARLAGVARTPAEPSEPLTAAYVDLIFAVGYARAGDAPRARMCVARAGLALAAPDPVPRMLVALFAQRIADALAGRSRFAAWSPDVATAVDALDRVPRLDIDRLRATLATLEAERSRVDPATPVRRSTFAWDPSAVEQAIAGGADHLEVLEVLVALPEATAMPLLMTVLPAIRGDARALVRGLDVVGCHRWGEFAPELVRGLCAAWSGIGSASARFDVLAPSARVLCSLGLRDELAALLDAVQRAGDRDARCALLVAGGRAWLGDPDALAILDAALDEPSELAPMPAIAAATVLVPADAAAGLRSRMIGRFATVTDHLSVLSFVDALVCAIADRSPDRA